MWQVPDIECGLAADQSNRRLSFSQPRLELTFVTTVYTPPQMFHYRFLHFKCCLLLSSESAE